MPEVTGTQGKPDFSCRVSYIGLVFGALGVKCSKEEVMRKMCPPPIRNRCLVLLMKYSGRLTAVSIPLYAQPTIMLTTFMYVL
jgi:hypothetical protein